MFGFTGFVCLISVEQEKMDKSAFEQKARTWREKAVSASLHYGAGREEAEDIAQDVMLRLWQMHDELERYQSVEAIVTIMARHQLRKYGWKESCNRCPPPNAPYYICGKWNGAVTKR